MIRWSNIAGIWIKERHTPLSQDLCVRFRRGTGCALVLLNGVEISPSEAQQTKPLELEAIAIFTPTDATTFYGTRAAGGAVLMWTRSGRW